MASKTTVFTVRASAERRRRAVERLSLISVYTSSNGSRTLLSFSTLNTMQVYLPSGDANASYAVYIVAELRDVYGAIASYNMSMMTVRAFVATGSSTIVSFQVMPDRAAIDSFMSLSQQSATQGGSNDAMQMMLYAGDQNTASQMVQSLSQTLNTMSSTSQQAATSGKGKAFENLLTTMCSLEQALYQRRLSKHQV